MTQVNGKQEVSLAAGFGAVHYGETTIELHLGGRLTVKTNRDIDVYTSGALHVHPAANETSSKVVPHRSAPAASCATPQIGDVMPAGHPNEGWIYGGISQTTQEPFYVAPVDSGVFPLKEALAFAERNGSRIPSDDELDQLRDARGTGALKGTFNPASWYWSSYGKTVHTRSALHFSDGNKKSFYETNELSLRCVR